MSHKPLLFYSTNQKSPPVTFRQALLKGQAPDRGLYMPNQVPVLMEDELVAYTEMPYPGIAYEIARKYLRGEIPDVDLMRICVDSYNYEIPLEQVYERKYILRLDRGPTASFKDFAARMMGRLMQYYLRQEKQELLILTATSGDTGSAVASAFYGLDNIRVVILFPRSEVTARQRRQMTTLGKNIHVLALDAKFDDCQSLVKTAFADPVLDSLHLSSANSINIGRLIPQIVYYFYAFARLWKEVDERAFIAVPSGNFGDMMGGVLAMKMGLPVEKFIIAVNENDEFPRYLHGGAYNKIEPSRNCISSAMNVGHPSNLARLVAVYGGMMDETGRIHKPADLQKMQRELFSVSVDDVRTRSTIDSAWNKYRLLLEPHGAVGWAGLQEYLMRHPAQDTPGKLCISLETAHPAKFPEEIQRILGIDPELPPSLQGIDDKPEQYGHIENNYSKFKEYLLANF
jgi:threonine synthase